MGDPDTTPTLHATFAVAMTRLAAEVVAAHGLAPGRPRGEPGYFEAAGLAGFLDDVAHLAPAAGDPRPADMSALVARLAPHAGASRDGLRDCYEAMVPPAMRKALGEFYTPDWLVDLTLDAAAPEDWLAADALDPTCGSGAFLVALIQRKREAAARQGLDAAATRRAILATVTGHDLNPLAVLAARVNYLMAIADLLVPGQPVTLPVHLRDAIAAPAGTRRHGLLVGNPPWVRWSKLPAAYRAEVQDACRAYDVFAGHAYHGGAELDVAGLVAHAAAAKWLRPGGTVAFVLPQPLFQAPAAAGFRRFALGDGMHLVPRAVEDLQALRPFPQAQNKTVVARFEKVRGEAPAYPVPYRAWQPAGPRAIDPRAALPDVLARVRREPMEAHAIAGPGSPWIVLPPGRFAALRGLARPCAWAEGRKGVTTDLNGVYFVPIRGEERDRVRIATRPEAGRKAIGEPVEAWVEPALLYPLVKGAAAIDTCHLAPGEPLYAFVPNAGITRGELAAAEARMAELPLTAAYFARFEPLLRARSTWRLRLTAGPPYTVYNVGAYTFAPWKVVWAEMAAGFRAAVAGPAEVPGVGLRPRVPDHKAYFVAFDQPAPAYYLCGLLAAPTVAAFIDAHHVHIQIGDVFKHLDLPPFDAADPAHLALAGLVEAAHGTPDAGLRAGVVADVRAAAEAIVATFLTAR